LAEQAVDKKVDIIVLGINYNRYKYIVPLLSEELKRLNNNNI
jgi:uncharacterized protein YktA (UPF0223 family)